MDRYYLCTFSIYKHGDLNTRPWTKEACIKATNRREAYQKAQEVCASPSFSSLEDAVRCRHRDICPVDAETVLSGNAPLRVINI